MFLKSIKQTEKGEKVTSAVGKIHLSVEVGKMEVDMLINFAASLSLGL